MWTKCLTCLSTTRAYNLVCPAIPLETRKNLANWKVFLVLSQTQVSDLIFAKQEMTWKDHGYPVSALQLSPLDSRWCLIAMMPFCLFALSFFSAHFPTKGQRFAALIHSDPPIQGIQKLSKTQTYFFFFSHFSDFERLETSPPPQLPLPPHPVLAKSQIFKDLCEHCVNHKYQIYRNFRSIERTCI